MDDIIESLKIEFAYTEKNDPLKKLQALTNTLAKLQKVSENNTGITALSKKLQGLNKVSLTKITNQLQKVADLCKIIKFPTIPDINRRLNESQSKQRPNVEYQDAPDINNESYKTLRTRTTSGEEESYSAIKESEEHSAKLEQALTRCNTIWESFKNNSSIANEYVSKLQSALNSKADFSSETDYKKAFQFSIDTPNKIDDITSKMISLKAEYEKIVNADPSNIKGLDRLSTTMTSLVSKLSSTGSATDSIRKKIEKLGEESSKASGKIGKFISSTFRIAGYRAIRFMLSLMTNSIKSGLTNVATFSDSLSNSLSQLKGVGTYISNSLGAAITPLIISLTPAIINLSHVLVNVLNEFNKFFSVITGKNSYTIAKKNIDDYTNSINNAANATTGFDELNVISSSSSTTDYSDMFETVELTNMEIGSTITQILGVTTALTGLLVLFKGQTILNFFKNIDSNITGLASSLKNLSIGAKVTSSLALLTTQATVCYNAFYDIFSGSKTVGEGFMQLVPITVIVGTALTAMWGPVGILITGAVILITEVIAKFNAVKQAAKDKSMAKFWNTTGVAIDDATSAVKKYLKAIGLDEQAEWNETLAQTNDELIDAIRDYDVLFTILSSRDELDSSDIDKLSEAFNTLADAASAVNDAAIGNLMSSIKTGIEMNITPELTGKLTGLISSLEVAQDLINVKVSGIRAEYQNLLNEIVDNGGKITDEQRTMLTELRSEISKFTLSDNSSSAYWSESLREASSSGITAGSSREEVESKLSTLTQDRKDYLKILKEGFTSSSWTLEQLIETDRTEFGGSLGLYEEGKSFEENSNYLALLESYEAQIAEVNSQYNSVLDGVISAFKDTMSTENFEWWQYATAWFNDQGLYGRSDAKNEQEDLLAYIESLKGYATGGFPDEGQMFIAREAGAELVGNIGGRTGVANNDQIIEGIKEGVYEAVVSANQNRDSNNEVSLAVYLDGKQISATVEKYQKKNEIGKSIYKGGVLNGL